MVNYSSLFRYTFLLFYCLSCNGQNKEVTKETMEKLAVAEFKFVTNYKVKPVYSLQISKQGCRVIVEAFSEDYRFVENEGESMMIPFNYMITKSGEQKVKIKVYPVEGELYITKYANVAINVYNASDKDTPLNYYKKIESFSLPQGLETQKLPYYEHIINFNATVPFDYTKELEGATDLSKTANIKEKILKKYKDMQNIAKQNDVPKYIQENLFSFGKVSNTTYQTLDELKQFYTENPDRLITPSLKAVNKEFLPLDDCEIQFYANGKVAALWHKSKMTSGLDMKFRYKKNDGTMGEGTNADPLFLWMPTGSKELKVW